MHKLQWFKRDAGGIEGMSAPKDLIARFFKGLSAQRILGEGGVLKLNVGRGLVGLVESEIVLQYHFFSFQTFSLIKFYIFPKGKII
jgi:hypothetical protein